MKTKLSLTILAILFVLLALSGCRLGIGVGFQFRLGFVYFESTDPSVYGPLILDGQMIGFLEPLDRFKHLTTLDFRHKLELVNPSCPDGLCTWMLRPPLTAGEIIYLSIPVLEEEPMEEEPMEEAEEE